MPTVPRPIAGTYRAPYPPQGLRMELPPEEFRLTQEQFLAQLDKWARLISKKAKWWWLNYREHAEFEEIRQVIVYGWWEASRRYDTRRGIKFHSYAGHYGDNAVRALLRNEITRGVWVPDLAKRRGLHRLTVASLDAAPDGFDSPAGATAVAREEDPGPDLPGDFWDRVRKVLPARDWRVIAARFRDGLTPARTARAVGVSRMRVYQIERRALETLARYEKLLTGLTDHLPARAG